MNTMWVENKLNRHLVSGYERCCNHPCHVLAKKDRKTKQYYYCWQGLIFCSLVCMFDKMTKIPEM